jgi:hypothetical protein
MWMLNILCIYIGPYSTSKCCRAMTEKRSNLAAVKCHNYVTLTR